MRKTDTQPTITAADMALAGEALSLEQKEAFSLLLHWHPEHETLINGRYRMEKYLGRGGFGLVFAAWDKDQRCRVALKFLNPFQVSSLRKRQRIQREFTIARKMDHPGLVQLFALDSWRGIHFLVMEYLQGPTLGQLIQEKGPLNWTELKPISEQLIEIVSFLHRHNVIHRDIKPSNIIVGPDKRVKLLDLGMSRELDDPQKTASTGELVGSPHYLPPELIRGLKVTTASDVYQIALVLYYCVTGQHPFDQRDSETINILGKQLNEQLTLPRKPALPGPFRLLMALSLKKNPSKRPPNAAAMAELLRPSPCKRCKRMLFGLGIWGRAAAFMLVLALVWLFLRFGLPPSDVQKTEGGDLVGLNALGLEIWRHSPPAGQEFSLVDSRLDAKRNRSIRILQEKPNRRFTYTVEGIKPRDFPPLWIRLNNRGKIVSRIKLSRLPAMDHFDFFPLTTIKELSAMDIDGDGQPEQIISIRNALSMFPSLATVWGAGDEPQYTLYTPGASDDKAFIQSLQDHQRDGRSDICCFTLSNPYCHYYIWAWGLDAHSVIPPSFSGRYPQRTLTRNMVFLPQTSSLKTHLWTAENRLELTSTRNQLRIVYLRSGMMTIHLPDGEIRSHQEPFQANQAALALLNDAFAAFYADQESRAAQILTEIDTDSLSNPWFRSLIEYSRAEAASRLGQNDLAMAHLNRSLEHDPWNADAQNRQCELLLITRGPKAALEKLNQLSSNYGQFWGLAYGQDLFRFCCALWDGRMAEALDIKSIMVDKGLEDSLQKDLPLSGMLELFLREGGNRRLAIDNFSIPQSNKMALFDISEQQLILARLLMLEGERSRAEAIFRYHYDNTRIYKPLAAVSLAWCLIENGRFKEGVTLAREGFARLQVMSIGQFWPRFWLFYEAYAYGRAMEKAGLSQEARLGYETCIEANPHTGLAVDAAARLSQL